MEDYERAIKEYEEYIAQNGIDEKAINAYSIVASDVLENKKNYEKGFQYSQRTKELVNNFSFEKTGANIWALEKYAFDNGVTFEIIESFWRVLLAEARCMKLDSYFLYLERHRDPEDRFYLPRRDKLIQHGYIQGLQDLVDDKLDILSISMALYL